MLGCFNKEELKYFKIVSKIKEEIEEVIIAIKIPFLIIDFDFTVADTLIIEVFNEKQLIDRNNIMEGNIKEYNEIPSIPNDLVNIILLIKLNNLINKLDINTINVFLINLFFIKTPLEYYMKPYYFYEFLKK